jgi:hypothetical protein
MSPLTQKHSFERRAHLASSATRRPTEGDYSREESGATKTPVCVTGRSLSEAVQVNKGKKGGAPESLLAAPASPDDRPPRRNRRAGCGLLTNPPEFQTERVDWMRLPVYQAGNLPGGT